MNFTVFILGLLVVAKTYRKHCKEPNNTGEFHVQPKDWGKTGNDYELGKSSQGRGRRRGSGRDRVLFRTGATPFITGTVFFIRTLPWLLSLNHHRGLEREKKRKALLAGWPKSSRSLSHSSRQSEPYYTTSGCQEPGSSFYYNTIDREKNQRKFAASLREDRRGIGWGFTFHYFPKVSPFLRTRHGRKIYFKEAKNCLFYTFCKTGTIRRMFSKKHLPFSRVRNMLWCGSKMFLKSTNNFCFSEQPSSVPTPYIRGLTKPRGRRQQERH